MFPRFLGRKEEFENSFTYFCNIHFAKTLLVCRVRSHTCQMATSVWQSSPMPMQCAMSPFMVCTSRRGVISFSRRAAASTLYICRSVSSLEKSTERERLLGSSDEYVCCGHSLLAEP